MSKLFAFWRNWDDDQKNMARKILGLVFYALVFFYLLSVLSYFFTWKEDQSLLSDPDMMAASVDVSNIGGKLGYKFANLVVTRLFGVAGLMLLLFFWAMARRLFSYKWQKPMLKTLLVSLSGAFVLSLLFASVSKFHPLDSMFGSGLGGGCGSFVISWAENLFGPVLSFLFVLILLICWLFFSSRRFTVWVSGWGNKKEEEPESMPEPEVKPEVKPEPKPEPAPEPIVEPIVEPIDSTDSTEDGDESNKVPEEETIEVVMEGDELSTDIKKPLPRIDVREDLPAFKFCPLDILENHSYGKQEVSSEELTRNNNKIRATLSNYNIKVLDVKAVVGPTVTLYKVYPDRGVRISEIKRLQEDIAMSLNAKGVRVITMSDCVGIEVANDVASIVPIRALLNDDNFRNSNAELPIAMGYTITQKVKVFDLADAPHLLVAGATKMGKSVGLNVIISSLLYSKHPSEMKMVFIDPKMVEFSAYERLLKHYLAVLPEAADENQERANSIVKKPKEAEKILRSLCIEMDERYELLSKAYVPNIKLYNEKYKDRHLLPTEGHHFLPYIVVVIDEYADLTLTNSGNSESKAQSRSIQNSIIRLAQKGRAAGLHVILATQRPSVDVISGIIKANFPTRIAFRVTSRVDSVTILDTPGAEKLIGRGDMLYYSGVDIERVQCGFVSNDEVLAITKYIGDQIGYRKSFNTPYYLPDPTPDAGEGGSGLIDMKELDERFEEAARMVVMSQRGSTSDLQRKLGMGYAKAGRVMDQLEAAGIVGPQEGSKPRQVLVQDTDTLNSILKAYLK